MAQKHQDIIDYFHFWPSKALSIIGLSLFLIVSLAVLTMTVKTRQWFMLIASIVGLMEMGGYACRISMLSKPQYGVYVAMQCLLIIPPSFLALVQYITLGKVAGLVKQRFPDRKLLVKPKAVMIGFFVIELAALACQGAGAGLSVSNDGVNQNESAGKALLIVGLVALVVLIAIYWATAIYVHASPAYGVRQSPNLRWLFPVLYVCTALLLTRNIFRLIEFSQGWYGRLAVQEKYFYTLDALMILLILVVNAFFHFGLYLKAYPGEQQAKPVAHALEMA